MDEVQVRWPNGTVETLRDVPADYIYTVVEGQGIKDKVPLPALGAEKDRARPTR